MYTFLLLILYKRLASLQFIIATNADTVKEICFTYFKKFYLLSPERRLVMIFIKYNLTVQQLKSELSGMDKICATVPLTSCCNTTDFLIDNSTSKGCIVFLQTHFLRNKDFVKQYIYPKQTPFPSFLKPYEGFFGIVYCYTQ